MSFYGFNDVVDCGVPDNLDGPITICIWVRAYSFGENGVGRIFDNGTMVFRLNESGGGRVELASGGMGTFARTADASFPESFFNEWVSLFATRTANGTATIYINGVNKTAVTSSGIPVSATKNLLIGNNNVGDAAFNGITSYARIYDSILDEDVLLQMEKNEKKKYYS